MLFSPWRVSSSRGLFHSAWLLLQKGISFLKNSFLKDSCIDIGYFICRISQQLHWKLISLLVNSRSIIQWVEQRRNYKLVMIPQRRTINCVELRLLFDMMQIMVILDLGSQNSLSFLKKLVWKHSTLELWLCYLSLIYIHLFWHLFDLLYLMVITIDDQIKRWIKIEFQW